MKRFLIIILTFIIILSVQIPVFCAISINDMVLQALELNYSRGNGVIPSSFMYYAVFLTMTTTSDNKVAIIFSENPVISSGSPIIVYLFSSNGGSPFIWHGGVTYLTTLVNNNASVYIRIKFPSGDYSVNADQYLSNISTATISDASTVESALKGYNSSLTWNHSYTVSLPDVSSLQALVDESILIDDIGYTADSWNYFQESLQESQSLINSDYYTVSTVNLSYNKLLNAKESLEFDIANLPDRAGFQNLVNSAKSIINDGYTGVSWSAFQSAVSSAESFLNLTYYTADELESAYSALESAIYGLRYPLPSGSLQTSINNCSDYVESDYTAESWSVFQSALSHANNLLSSGDYTSDELSQAQRNLDNAVSNLTWKALETPPMPDGHRYLIDGILPSDLTLANDAIMQNIDYGRTAGFWVFIPLIIVGISIKLIRSIFGVSGESGFIDSNSPNDNSFFNSDNKK